MAYRPVPFTVRICAYCKTSFEAKDRRRIYCTNSCNTRAWLARRSDQLGQDNSNSTMKKQELDFTLKNITTIAAGSAITAGLNYAVNDRPFYEALAERMSRLEKYLGHAAGKASIESKKMDQFIKAVRLTSLEIDTQLRQIESNSNNKQLP